MFYVVAGTLQNVQLGQLCYICINSNYNTITAVLIIYKALVTLTFTYHGLNGEHMARLHNSNCFIFWEINKYRNQAVAREWFQKSKTLKMVTTCDYLLA